MSGNPSPSVPSSATPANNEEKMGAATNAQPSTSYSYTASGKKRRIQYCTFCKNHSIGAPKKNHLCPYKQCECSLCVLQRKAQVTMRHQQRVWRHQKNKLTYGKFQDVTNVITEKGQVCDKCRNHNKIEMKKNHQCPYNECKCQYCSLTFKRRELMKHLQRVRRSKVTMQDSVIPISGGQNPQNGLQESQRREEDAQEEEEEGALDDPEQLLGEGSSPQLSCSVDSSEAYEENSNSWSNDNWSSSQQSPPLCPDNKGISNEDMLSLSPSSKMSTSSVPPSPPPLIPLAHNYQIPSNLDKSQMNDYDECNSPPSLWPLYDEEETISPSPRRPPPMDPSSFDYYHSIPSTSSGTSEHPTPRCSQHYYVCGPVKFGPNPEDYHLRQCNWPPSSSVRNPTQRTDPDSPPMMLMSTNEQDTFSHPPEAADPNTLYHQCSSRSKPAFYVYNTNDRYINSRNSYPQNVSSKPIYVKRTHQERGN